VVLGEKVVYMALGGSSGLSGDWGMLAIKTRWSASSTTYIIDRGGHYGEPHLAAG
jgi:hypothetical protein